MTVSDILSSVKFVVSPDGCQPAVVVDLDVWEQIVTLCDDAEEMKNNSNKSKKFEEMRAEYDFSGGVRGKHAAAYREGHTVTTHKKDGSTVIQNFKLEEGAVVLAPDVREYFPDAESVNNALRILISIAPKPLKKISKARTGNKRTINPASVTS